jgi:hypothetical protein
MRPNLIDQGFGLAGECCSLADVRKYKLSGSKDGFWRWEANYAEQRLPHWADRISPHRKFTRPDVRGIPQHFRQAKVGNAQIASLQSRGDRTRPLA